MRKWLLALAVLSAPAAAQEDRVRDALALRERWQWLTRDVAFPAQWDADGRHFHYRKTVAGGFAFVEVDAATQAKRAPFDAAALARGLSAALGRTVDPLRLPFEQFAFADDRRAIEAEVDYAPVRCVLATMACEKVVDRHRPRGFGVVRDLSVPALNDPQRSPDGTLEALVVDDNLVVRAAGGGAEKWRSQDGTPGDFYDPETIAWAPDGRHVAAFRVRPGYRRIVTRVVSSPPGEVQPRVVQQLYPKPGDAVDQERPVIFDTATGRGATVDDALFPNPYYLSDLAWRADGRSLSFSYLRRGFGQARVIAADADTARAHVAVGEDAKTFVFNDKRWAHDVDNKGREILWASERDGWRHLYLIDGATGRVKRQITRGQWIVRDIARVDDTARRIWFSASGMDAGRDPYLKAWFRVDFDGRNLVRLTPDDGDTHDAAFAPDDARFVDVHSRVDKPPVAELRDGANGAMVATLERGDASALTAAGFRPPEPFVAKGRDGVTDIWGVVVRPRDFDPAKRYPVIENIYAGPHDSFVPKAFWPFGAFSGGDKAIGMQQLADLGFVVVMIDGMGTANRSKAFHDVAWKNMDDMGFPDRIAWMKALAAKDPSLDLSRVGLYGGSAGGQNTLSGLLFHPDFYKAGVAFAGCFDNRMDKIDWNEQWLGWPVDRSYLDASGVVNAAKLRGKLLLVVGEQDSNVDPASTMQVVDALIRVDKDFELLVIPNGEHAAGRSNGPVAYGQRREYDFFLRTLRGEGLTEWNAR